MSEVTILTGIFPKITETFILNQVIGLMNQGYKVNVISLLEPDLINVQPDFIDNNCLENLTILSIPNTMSKRLVLGVFIFFKLFFKTPIKTLKALNPQYSTATKSLKNLFVLNSLYNKKIPLLHAHFGPMGLIGAYLKDIGVVEKLICTFHGSDINSYPKTHGRNVYRALYRSADIITTNTNFTANKVISNGANQQKIEIIPVGLICKNFPLRKPDALQTTDKLLTVGRLVEKKGHIWMIKAMKELVKTYPDLIWNLIGSGPLEDSLKNSVKEMGLTSNIIFHGALSSKDVIKHLQSSNIFILPSVTASSGDMEGQGLVLQEAQSIGVPVVSTLHNGIPDGVLDGQSGYLVPEKDPMALKVAITKLLENPKLQEEMGLKGSEFVKCNYDIPMLSKRWIALYKSLK